MLDLLAKELFPSDDKEQSENTDKDQEKLSTDDELLQLKKSFAKEYFVKLQKEDGSLPGLILAETGTVEDYLTQEGILDAIKDKVLLGMLLGHILENQTLQKLDAMKEKLDVVKNKHDLHSLETEVLGKSAIAIVTPAQQESEEVGEQKQSTEAGQETQPKEEVVEKETSGQNQKTEPADQQKDKEQAQNQNQNQKKEDLDQSIGRIVEDKNILKQQKLLSILDKILAYDKSHDVYYNRGGRTSLKQGLDCSGLIIYAMRQIGLKEPGGDSRQMFSSLPTQKLTLESDKSLSKKTSVKPGDLLFWDSKNMTYNFSRSSIPKITKDGIKHRVHHVAFVKEVDYEAATITIVESNGRDGVVQRTTTLEKEKTAKHKSDLYVGTVNYDDLLAYTGPREHVLGNVA